MQAMAGGAEMIHFQWLWALAFLPLPLLVRYGLPAVNPERQAALKVPFLDDFNGMGMQGHRPASSHWMWLAIFAWCLLVLAAMRPQWLGEPIPQAVSGRDLMLAVDVSGSMQEKDFSVGGRQIDRLRAIRLVAGDFIQRRDGDRVGLILFGTTAYLQAPLTFDRKTVATLLNEAFIGITDDDPATSIGDAIGLAVKRMRRQQTEKSVLILLTDGANTAGEITPLKAAELAAENNLTIYTIGIGAESMQVRSLFGTRRVNPSRDLDEATLKAISQKTGGRYFRARDTQQLEDIYTLLDEMEPVERDQQYFRPRIELYTWPLALSLLMLTGLVWLRRGRL